MCSFHPTSSCWTVTFPQTVILSNCGSCWAPLTLIALDYLLERAMEENPRFTIDDEKLDKEGVVARVVEV